jgi:hypothetical protein
MEAVIGTVRLQSETCPQPLLGAPHPVLKGVRIFRLKGHQAVPLPDAYLDPIFSLERQRIRTTLVVPLPGRPQFPRKRQLRKVRTPQGNAPHESEGREPRGTRTDSAAERYRRWPARAQARVKWWSKSPPRIRVTGRHGKPRVVQDRTGDGRPACQPRVIVALRASGALRSGGVREMAVQLCASRVDRIRLTGERHSLFSNKSAAAHGSLAARLERAADELRAGLAHQKQRTGHQDRHAQRERGGKGGLE